MEYSKVYGFITKAGIQSKLPGGVLQKFLNFYYIWGKLRLTYKLGWDIPPNVFGPGLCIAHIGPVIVNSHAKIGKNCKIQSMVNIGANGGDDKAPKAGDNLYIGPGAKLFGSIELGNNVSVGANAVVNKSFLENDIVLAGVPAKIVRHKEIVDPDHQNHLAGE